MTFESHGTARPEDLARAMATTLRVNGMTFDGDRDVIEERAFNILWRNPADRGGFSYAEIKPNLALAIDFARADGPIDLNAEFAAA
jgi:hypothetical protein